MTAILLGIFCSISYAQTNTPNQTDAKNERTNSIIKKNLDVKETKEAAVEEIEKIIIEGQYDPENLPKKKKTIEQKLEQALYPKVPLADPPPIGYQIQCVKECKGPFCCSWVPGPRSYLRPDTEHK
jgi:hypothetical protein